MNRRWKQEAYLLALPAPRLSPGSSTQCVKTEFFPHSSRRRCWKGAEQGVVVCMSRLRVLRGSLWSCNYQTQSSSRTASTTWRGSVLLGTPDSLCGCVCRLLCLGSKWRQGKGPCRMVSWHHQEGPRAGLEVGRLAPPARAMLKVMNVILLLRKTSF